MTKPQPALPSPDDAVLADIQESANIMMVGKAKHAATIAALRQQLATTDASLKTALGEVEKLKGVLKQNNIPLPADNSDTQQ